MIQKKGSILYQIMKKIIKPIIPKFLFTFRNSMRIKLGKSLSNTCEIVNYKAQQMQEMKYKDYQPLPWINKTSYKRNHSTLSRWDAIEKEIKISGGSAMDIGCNLGFFVLSLAEKGFFTIGVDTQPGFKVYSEYAVKKADLHNAVFSTIEIAPDNIGSPKSSKYYSNTSFPVNSLPTVDIVIFMSVWHHWINAYGFVKSKHMLRILWEKTNYALFFESGED